MEKSGPKKTMTARDVINVPQKGVRARGVGHFFLFRSPLGNLFVTFFLLLTFLVTFCLPPFAAGRREKILRVFLRPEIGQFSPHFGGISLPSYTEKPGEKGRKVQKSSGDGAPKLQISVPCRGRTRPEKSHYERGIFTRRIQGIR